MWYHTGVKVPGTVGDSRLFGLGSYAAIAARTQEGIIRHVSAAMGAATKRLGWQFPVVRFRSP